MMNACDLHGRSVKLSMEHHHKAQEANRCDLPALNSVDAQTFWLRRQFVWTNGARQGVNLPPMRASFSGIVDPMIPTSAQHLI